MKIINVIDTREYVQGANNKWFPVPGSGDSNICDRCGKSHEVHYHIEIDGQGKIVGGGCAKKDGLITDTQHKSLGSASITLAKNQAELKHLIAKKDKQEEILKVVDLLKVPEIKKGEFVARNDRESIAVFEMDDIKVNVFRYNGNSEIAQYNNRSNLKTAMDNLIFKWRLKRFKDLACFEYDSNLKYDIEKVQHQIKRAEKKIHQIISEGK